MTLPDTTPKTPMVAPLEVQLTDLVFVAFDTETTGLDAASARLVELSGVKFLSDGTEISTFQSLVNPEMPIPKESTNVHGITDDMVKDQPNTEAVIQLFNEWLSKSNGTNDAHAPVLIAHNAPFDVSFLEAAHTRCNLELPDNIVLDTLTLSRRLIRDSENHQLSTLIRHLRLKDDGYHRALSDSYHVRNLFLVLLERIGANSLADVVKVAGKLRLSAGTEADNPSYWSSTPECQVIQTAIDKKLKLRIVYSGGRSKERVVTPLSVVITGQKPYLRAFCHLADDERTFRIDRIVSVEAVESES